MAELLRQKELLLQEMHHRVANGLQIIAGILLLKAAQNCSVIAPCASE
jgi:two-component sensor histidine kinase